MDTISTEEVARQIKADLKVRNLNRAAVARKIGTSPQSFYNMLGGNRRFSFRIAELLNKELGYSIDFLTRGVGTLYPDGDVVELPALGFYLLDESDLSLREKLLSRYNAAFSRICTLVDKETAKLHEQSYTASINKLISQNHELLSKLEFEPKSNLELQLVSGLIGTYNLIVTLLDPSRIIEDLKLLDKQEEEQRG